MVDLISSFTKMETEILELRRQETEKKRAAGEMEGQYTEQLRILRKARAEAQALHGGGGIPGREGTVGRSFPTEIVDPSDEDFGFLWAASDPESGEPMYDVRVVSGYKTTRERAHAAAQVYGHQLREKSLANAVFATGETSASDGASARSSLGSVVRYGNEWSRLSGWLYFLGDLTRNEKVIQLLTSEGSESVQQDEGPEVGRDVQ